VPPSPGYWYLRSRPSWSRVSRVAPLSRSSHLAFRTQGHLHGLLRGLDRRRSADPSAEGMSFLRAARDVESPRPARPARPARTARRARRGRASRPAGLGRESGRSRPTWPVRRGRGGRTAGPDGATRALRRRRTGTCRTAGSRWAHRTARAARTAWNDRTAWTSGSGWTDRSGRAGRPGRPVGLSADSRHAGHVGCQCTAEHARYRDGDMSQRQGLAGRRGRRHDDRDAEVPSRPRVLLCVQHDHVDGCRRRCDRRSRRRKHHDRHGVRALLAVVP
jgi:hypothetical protein